MRRAPAPRSSSPDCGVSRARHQEAVLQFNSRTKVDAVRQKVDAVKNTMSSNIDKARPARTLASRLLPC
jgi:hypothetical protein